MVRLIAHFWRGRSWGLVLALVGCPRRDPRDMATTVDSRNPGILRFVRDEDAHPEKSLVKPAWLLSEGDT